MTIAEFLTARFAEDEELARAADEAGEWFTRSNPRTSAVYGTEARGPVAEAISYRVAPHIARHDPARVLREVEAKRAIAAEAARPVIREPHPFGAIRWFGDGRVHKVSGPMELDITEEWKRWAAEHQEPSDPTTLRHLAAVYADHEDFQEEWRP